MGAHLGSRCRTHCICLRKVLVWQKFLVTQSMSLPKKTRCVTVCVTMLGKASAFWTSPFQTSSSSYMLSPHELDKLWGVFGYTKLFCTQKRQDVWLFCTELNLIVYHSKFCALPNMQGTKMIKIHKKYLQCLHFPNLHLTAPFLVSPRFYNVLCIWEDKW